VTSTEFWAVTLFLRESDVSEKHDLQAIICQVQVADRENRAWKVWLDMLVPVWKVTEDSEEILLRNFGLFPNYAAL
jgi:hypothetical protein